MAVDDEISLRARSGVELHRELTGRRSSQRHSHAERGNDNDKVLPFPGVHLFRDVASLGGAIQAIPEKIPREICQAIFHPILTK
jgi:hypothetical protein